jgi:O-antigen ligase
MIALVAVAIYALALWGFFNPFVGLMGLLAVSIIQPGELYPALGAFHIERVLFFVVFVSFVWRHGKPVFPPITKLFLLFWSTMFLSVPFAFWRMGALQFALDFGRVAIYHILIVNLVNTPRRFRIFLLVFALLIGWLAGSSCLGFLHGDLYLERGRFARAEGMTSSGGNPNELGITLVSSLPLVVLLVVDKPWRGRLLGLAVAALSGWVLVFTGSRTSIVALLFLLAAFVFSSKKRLLFLPIGVILLAVTWQVMPVEYQERYLSVATRDQDESYTNRLLAWQAGWHMFLDYPVTGVGGGQFQVANGAKYWPGEGQKVWLNAHSLYFQIIAELGLCGTAAFCAYLFALFRLNRSLGKELSLLPDAPAWLRHYPLACSLILLVLLFVGYAAHDLYRSTWYMLGALSGCAHTVIGHLGEEETPTTEKEPIGLTASSRTSNSSQEVVERF